MRKITNRKAVSPVIATVILVAVAITVSVAVSYWMSGISAQYTQFEKVEIQTGYSQKDPTGLGWIITLDLKNSGSAAATISTIFINESPLDLSAYACLSLADANNTLELLATGMVAIGETLESGQTGTILVYVPVSAPGYLSSGTTLDLKLHSANGNDYIKLVKLV